ncbi:hypothetical protein ASPTUDRAFT_164902 [Aspergillus tubingensis CBS 134.48]|uniref:Zn(2)-C6 fungal-type domain-containing protein n=1 Tax=Aspergillus tubingensis (strain CBS 134.48) TaxID=767770 RepID=A0A1L9NQL7_ASPTC|nr:hypothetical protein ASPTUDRAFT_164902 [Aspergillus tubingensis CBS 134.48]
MSSLRTVQNRFKCRISGCTSSFQRKEHRNRHEGQHTGALARECPLCARTFSRSDSLRRHIRLDHGPDEPIRVSQACRPCRLAKIRCNGGIPCSRCSTQARHCIYDDGQRPRQRQDQQVQISESTYLLQTSQSPEDQPSPFSALPSVEDHDSTTRFTPYIHLYFAHFHPLWPILHRATFNPSDEPLLLLQAVSMIGLWVSDEPSAREVAIGLHRKLGSAILSQRENWTHALPFYTEAFDKENNTSIVEQATASRCPVATYQAILLYLIFSLVLNHNSIDNTTSNNDNTGICTIPRPLDLTLTISKMDHHILSLLVGTCLRNRIFYYPQMMERYHHTMQSVTCIWVGMEELKRLGLALYRVCRLCGSGSDRLASEFDSVEGGEGRKILRISDLQFPPPDSRHLWEAQSDRELSRLLQMEACRSGMRLDGRDEENWISSCGRLLDEAGMERWWF